MSNLARHVAWLSAAILAGCGLATSGTEAEPGDASTQADVQGDGANGLHDASGSSSSGSSSGASSSGGDAAAHADSSAHDGGPLDATAKDAPAPVDAPEETTGVDVAPTPCLGTTQSCGAPGQCIDCSSSAQGTACVQGACGCKDPKQDCAIDQACSSSHVCSSSCAGGLTCNGGCCDGFGLCFVGGQDDGCGDNGGPCQSCGGQTPTCSGGTCTSACDATSSPCGAGFCCRGGTCAAAGTPQACGASCADCTDAAAGSACVAGACGCNGSADCASSPQGSFCLPSKACGCMGDGQCPDPSTCVGNQCAVACNLPQRPCASGCCSDMQGTCVAACGGGDSCQQGFCQ
jgi:hypothetical protein